MSAIFWFSAVSLFYVFIGYPVLLALWARFSSLPMQHENHEFPRESGYEPWVSILIVARNEQAHIRHKILNLLAIDYPRDKLQIVIASDASDDETDAIVSEYRSQGIGLRTRNQAAGKPANLNDNIPLLTGEIVVLMDARQSVYADCVRSLLRNFSDRKVGAVSGELMLAEPPAEAGNSTGSGVGFYWRYEKFLRKKESSIDSSVGATGALYAIRRELFRPIAAETLIDDLLIPMNIVRQGYRVVFEPGAIAQETATITASTEFRRKVRTIAGNFQLFVKEPWLLSPVQNRIWLQTLSHKFGRLTAPALLLLLFLSNIALLDSIFFQLTLAMQSIFYLAALSIAISESSGHSGRRWKSVRALAVPYAFCLLNWATVIGFTRFVFNKQIRWKQ